VNAHPAAEEPVDAPCDAPCDTVVIGAGMAGLQAAALLAEAGQRVVVLDKGRRHGGRMATRRVDDATFDTGAITFTCDSPAMRSAVVGWASAGHARQDDGTADRVEPETWRGSPTMRALPASIAEQLVTRPAGSPGHVEVRLATVVTDLAGDPHGWQVAFTHGPTPGLLAAAAIVLTAPAPQALALLGRAGTRASAETLALLEGAVYAPSITVLARPTDRTLPPDALPTLTVPVGPGTVAPDLARIHDNARSGASSVAAVTLQASRAFSRAHVDGDRDVAAATLCAQASAALGVPLDVVHVHVWRYAQVESGICVEGRPPALLDTTTGAPLIIAGDLFAPAWSETEGDPAVSTRGVERAFLSGGAAARLLLSGVRADA